MSKNVVIFLVFIHSTHFLGLKYMMVLGLVVNVLRASALSIFSLCADIW